MRIIILYAAIVVGLLGITVACSGRVVSNTEYHNGQTLCVDASKMDVEGNWSLFLDSVCDIRMMPLLLDSTDLLSEIKCIKVCDGRFYLSDKVTKALYCCDSTGHKVFSIKAFGRGPGEYLDLTDFCVHDDTLYLLDRIGAKILNYSAIDGCYIGSVDISRKDDYYGIHVSDGRFWLLRSVYSYTVKSNVCPLAEFDRTGQHLNDFLPQGDRYVDRLANYHMDCLIYPMNSDIHFVIPMRNSIYEISGDSVFVKYRFDFGDRDLDRYIDDKDTRMSDDEFSEMRDSRKMVAIASNVAETDSHIIIPLWNGNDGLFMLYDKRDGSNKLYRRKISGVYFFMGGDSHVYAVGNDCFATIVSPFNIVPFPDRSKVSKASENVKVAYDQLASLNLSEDDNPILMLFRVP